MQIFASLPKSLAALVLLAACAVSAAPASGVHVMVRGQDGSFTDSSDLAKTISARFNGTLETAELDGRSAAATASVQACKSADCTDCRPVFDGTFTQSTSCIPVASTQCLIITNLSGANVQYWSGSTCNGRHTSYGACGASSAHVSSPNTNSLAVQTGCL